MNTCQYIDSLFADYQETSMLMDFKEELKSFLDERINNLIKSGMDENTAFTKATAELGDLSALAEEISRKKKQEILSEMYLKTRHYMSIRRIIFYVLFGTLLGFGLIATALAGLFSNGIDGMLGTLLVFGGTPFLGFLFLILTQETSVREGMGWRRALLYVLTAAVFLFGIFTFLIVFFENGNGLAEATATLIPFVLPSLAAGAFLMLTEKDRRKPWVILEHKEQMKHARNRFGDPAREARFGLFCAALWVGAITAFILLTIILGIKFSWTIIAAALSGQLLLLARFTKVE